MTDCGLCAAGGGAPPIAIAAAADDRLRLFAGLC